MELVHKTSKISKTDKEPIAKYLCSYCNERLDTSEKLVIHERLHTESEISKTVKEPIVKYLCSYCSECLDTSEKLVIHERLHVFMQEKESFNNFVNVNENI